MRWLLLALAPAITACATPRGDFYAVWVSPDFQPDQVESVMGALDDWSSAVPVRFEPIVAYKDRGSDHVIVIRPGTKVRDLDPGEDAIGITYSSDGIDGGEVSVDPGACAGSLQGVVAHEMGHAMGLDHDRTCGGQGCLMWPDIVGRWVSHVTPDDAAQWSRIRGRVYSGL